MGPHQYPWGFEGAEQPQTDGGRVVERIDGDPDAVIRRAEEIERLGNLMLRAATTLEAFADGDLGAGDAMQSVRDKSGEVFASLREAGDLYAPSGSALLTYGRALSDVQVAAHPLVTRSRTEWQSVVAAAATLQDAVDAQQQHDALAAEADADSAAATEPRPSSATEQAALDAAVAEWQSYWGAYDAPVAAWETAYANAVDGLRDASDAGPEDNFWDDMMPIVEGLLIALAVIGLVAFVIAFFVTGPIAAVLGAIALVAGIVSVVLEASKFLAQRGDPLALALSIFSVIPFARLSTLGQVANAAGDARGFMGVVRHLGGTFTDAAAVIRTGAEGVPLATVIPTQAQRIMNLGGFIDGAAGTLQHVAGFLQGIAQVYAAGGDAIALNDVIEQANR